MKWLSRAYVVYHLFQVPYICVNYTTCILILAISYAEWLNSSAPKQNGRHFADDVFKCIFVNGKFGILIQISLNFVPKSPIDNNPALV